MFRIPPAMDESTRTRCDALIKLMENACSEMLLAPDWTLNMQIVDELNRQKDPVILSEVIRVVRKRLGSNNIRVLSVSLTLAETLVKNCDTHVQREIASERFMAAMSRIARNHSFKTNRESMAIADQALDIIQAWGEAFLPRRREFPLFVNTYHLLRAEGLPFKEQYQPGRPPVLDPGAGSLLDRSASAAQGVALGKGGGHGRAGKGRGHGGGGTPGGGDSASVNGELGVLSVSDREIVSTGESCSEMLEQVLQAAESRREVRDSEIATELVEQLKAMGPKIARIIEANGEGDPAMLEALFKVNDAVDNALRLYKDVLGGLKSVPFLPPSRHSSGVDEVSGGMEKLSVKQPAGARIPTLSGPPSHKKGQGKKARAQEATETLDLLSGFELEGASIDALDGSSRSLQGGTGVSSAVSSSSTPAPAAATVAVDMFSGFPMAAAGASAGGGPGIVGPQAGVMTLGGQALTGQQAPQPLPRSQSQPAPSGPRTAADKAQRLLDNLGALYAVGSTRNVALEGMGAGGPASSHGFPAFSDAGTGSGTTSVGQPAWTGGSGAGDQAMPAAGAVAGDAQASPFDAFNAFGVEAQPPPQQQQQQQSYQQPHHEAQGSGGSSMVPWEGQESSQGQPQDPFQPQGYYQPQDYQHNPQSFQQQPQDFQQQPQDFQQQPQAFQQQPQAFQQQPQDFQQQPQDFQQQPQGFQQQPQNFQQQPQDFQQQHQDFQQQPQDFQLQPQDFQQQPQDFQQQPQDFQQQPQDFQQQPQDFQQQPQDFQQQPQAFQQQPHAFQQQPQAFQQQPHAFQQQPQAFQQQPAQGFQHP